jgi:hypothetical protein
MEQPSFCHIRSVLRRYQAADHPITQERLRSELRVRGGEKDIKT